MKLIGVIGGMSAESTAIYYTLFNQKIRNRFGGLHSAELIIRSVDFAPIAELQAQAQWEEAGERLACLAMQLERAGAELIVLATNTMHKVIGHIERSIDVPILHIADSTGEAICRAKLKRPGLMATRFTMEDSFYVERLSGRFGLDLIVPREIDRAETHRIIYEELCQGLIREASRDAFVTITKRLARRGADSLILGCTEVGMLLNQSNVAVPVFDTVALHVEAALNLALDNRKPPRETGKAGRQ
jgi:aspartate racemase